MILQMYKYYMHFKCAIIFCKSCILHRTIMSCGEINRMLCYHNINSHSHHHKSNLCQKCHLCQKFRCQ